MKVGIISDTHDNRAAVVWIIEYLNEHQIPVAFHGGDIIQPGVVRYFGEHYQGHLHYVLGNNDGETIMIAEMPQKFPNLTFHRREMRIEVEGKRIFMNHYSDTSETMAKTGDFDLTIGGHDHEYRAIPVGDCLFINPGNTLVKDKWMDYDGDKESSFVILDLATMEHERIMIPAQL